MQKTERVVWIPFEEIEPIVRNLLPIQSVNLIQEGILQFLGKGLSSITTGKQLQLLMAMRAVMRFHIQRLLKDSDLLEALTASKSQDKLRSYNETILWAFLSLATKLGILRRVNHDSSHPQFAVRYFNIQPKMIQFLEGLVYFRNTGTQSYPISDSWISTIKKGTFDYELLFSEFLLDFKSIHLEKKVPFPKGDQFFAMMGRKAFEKFTRPRFISLIEEMTVHSTIQSVLDVGCGHGDYIEVLRSKSSINVIHGIEKDNVLAGNTQKRFENSPNVAIFNQDFLQDKARASYDLILLNYSTFYFTKVEKTLLFKKLSEALSQTGRILVCTYFPESETIQEYARKHNRDSAFKALEITMGQPALYTEVLFNSGFYPFGTPDRWQEMTEVLKSAGLQIEGITHADSYYYSFFLKIKKNPPRRS